MQYLNMKGNNVANADVVAISSCISKIEKLSGIDKICLAVNSEVKIPMLVEIVKKMDEPVIMETNYDYLLFFLLIIISIIPHYIFLNNYFLFKQTFCAKFDIKNYGRHFQVYWESSSKTNSKIFLRDYWEKKFR